MYLMRKRSQKFPDIFLKNVVILDDYWTQAVSGRGEKQAIKLLVSKVVDAVLSGGEAHSRNF